MVIVKQYPGSQSNLYLATGIIVENVKKRLQEFSDFKSLYNIAYLNNIETEALACAQMPDEATRALGHESVRADLVLAAALCLKRWRSLKRYIATAFAANPEMYWNSAGWNFYADAANQSWESVTSLCQAGQDFILANKVALEANNNMPAAFIQLFDDAFTAYTTTRNLFYQKEELAKTGTEEKIAANNNLYEKVISMCLDGQHIFEDSGDAVISEYSYEAVSSMISPSTGSELAVETVKDQDGVSVPMAGVEISIVGTDKIQATNGDGRTSFTQLADGTIKVKAVADGMKEQLVDVTLDGTKKQLKLTMVPLFNSEMKAESNGAEVPVAVQ